MLGDLTFSYDPSPANDEWANLRAALVEGTPIFNAKGDLIGRLGPVQYFEDDGEQAASAKFTLTTD